MLDFFVCFLRSGFEWVKEVMEKKTLKNTGVGGGAFKWCQDITRGWSLSISGRTDHFRSHFAPEAPNPADAAARKSGLTPIFIPICPQTHTRTHVNGHISQMHPFAAGLQPTPVITGPRRRWMKKRKVTGCSNGKATGRQERSLWPGASQQKSTLGNLASLRAKGGCGLLFFCEAINNRFLVFSLDVAVNRV